MPVPVPQYSRPPAHPVFKQDRYSGDLNYPQPSAFPTLASSIPLPLPGPPPSFGTREEWISSLPLWRRNKPRRIWEEGDLRVAIDPDMQDFPSGLIRAGNAHIIKGDRAQACIPPLLTLYRVEQTPHLHHLQELEEDVDEIGSGTLDYDIESQWSGGTSHSGDLHEMEIDSTYDRHQLLSTVGGGPLRASDVFLRRPHLDDSYSPHSEEGVSSEPAPDEDPVSSPLGPITPFGVFVDRAVAAAHLSGPKVIPIAAPFEHVQYGVPPPVTTFQYGGTHQRPDIPSVPDVVSMPSASPSYKKVADPLAEWVATFVWKVCTTGMCLHTQYTYVHPTSIPLYPPHVIHRDSPTQHTQHSPPPPPFLASTIRSLLLSTLLQPSAVLLAAWYIVHLPVRFGHVSLRPDAVKEVRFRLELFGLGEWQDSGCFQAAEVHAPFRLVLLGCMLANKWLDDHTFSNKTWYVLCVSLLINDSDPFDRHTISGVPIQSLNRLESLALDIFSYDLSITPYEWNKWLVQVLAYHRSLSSAPSPQLISRPSSNPHFIVRKMIEDLLEPASRSCNDMHPKFQPQPVFLGLEERRRGRLDPTSAESSSEALEIDLDEDGPLREEYMPRRRGSRNGSFRKVNGNTTSVPFGPERGIEWEHAAEMQRPLPPPAKWSPAADEPLRRDLIREQAHYMAVQPPPVPPLIMMPHQYPPSSQGTAYPQGWGGAAPTFHLPSHPMHGRPYDYSRVRSVSVVDGRPYHLQDGGHWRSQSQTRIEYPCSSTAPKLPYQIPGLCWTGAEQYGYDAGYGQGFGHRVVFPQYGSQWVGH